MKYLKKFKPIEELTFADDFMFGKVLSDPKICKCVLEALLGIKVGKIHYPTLQKVLKTSYETHGVRLDVFAEDSKTLYDVEIQISREKDLPKRMRYYQSLLDVDYLIRGHKYFELKKSYIIFICLYDPFGKGLPVYEFERVCKQKNNIKFGDKSYFMCYNVKGFGNENSLVVREVLEFIANGKVAGQTSQMLDNAVRNIKKNEEHGREYMLSSLYYDDLKYAAEKAGRRAGMRAGKKEGLKLGIAQGIAQGMQQGIAQGIAQGMQQGMQQGIAQGEHNARIETARAFLAMAVATPEQIVQATGLSLAEVQSLAN